jgi:hypothetical protein
VQDEPNDSCRKTLVGKLFLKLLSGTANIEHQMRRQEQRHRTTDFAGDAMNPFFQNDEKSIIADRGNYSVSCRLMRESQT